MSDTSIEWADKSWNPIVGCSVASPGCTNCYAMRMAARIAAMQAPRLKANGHISPYVDLSQTSKAGPVWTGNVALASDDTLDQPCHADVLLELANP